MHRTTSTQLFCHNTTSTSTQTTIRQTSHIENQRMWRSRDRVIGLTSSLHCTSSTRCRWVHFHHVRPVYLNGVLPSILLPNLGLLWFSYTWQFTFFHKFTTFLSIHSSLTPTNIPTTSTQPFCHNCRWISPSLAQTDHDFSRYRNNLL